jgi:hypothetical protein
LSCHEPHHSKKPNLLPPNVRSTSQERALELYPTALCETCHNPEKL